MKVVFMLTLIMASTALGTAAESLARKFSKLTSATSVFKSLNIRFNNVNKISCASRCTRLKNQCYSFIFQKIKGYCELGSKVMRSTSSRDMSIDIFYWVPDTMDPICAERTTNDNTVHARNSQCEPRPDTCRDVVSNHPRIVVTLSSGLEVMCDTESDGGGWTIFQRRINGKISFSKTWAEYKSGFGNYSEGEFYLGNENIYTITSQRPHELRVDLTLQNDSSYFANYASFSLSGESVGYKLQIADYSGTAGDGLLPNYNKPFSTLDKDSTSHCAVTLNYEPWWFNYCTQSDLNGIWGNGNGVLGIVWKYLGNSIPLAEMKFREN